MENCHVPDDDHDGDDYEAQSQRGNRPIRFSIGHLQSTNGRDKFNQYGVGIGDWRTQELRNVAGSLR